MSYCSYMLGKSVAHKGCDNVVAKMPSLKKRNPINSCTYKNPFLSNKDLAVSSEIF